MSEHKKEAKASSAAKLQRMGLKLEDGSKSFTDERGGSPFEGLNSGNAGKMPITPSRFKRGGKVAHVEGAKAKHNLGKAPRKAAGGPLPHPGQHREPIPLPPRRSVADEYEAYNPNEDTDLGSKGFSYARGGLSSMNPAKRKAAIGAMIARKKKSGLPVAPPSQTTAGILGVTPSAPMLPPMRKSGGAAKHPDVAEDKKLVKKMVKPSALKDRAEKCWGGEAKRSKKFGGGALTGANPMLNNIQQTSSYPMGESGAGTNNRPGIDLAPSSFGPNMNGSGMGGRGVQLGLGTPMGTGWMSGAGMNNRPGYGPAFPSFGPNMNGSGFGYPVDLLPPGFGGGMGGAGMGGGRHAIDQLPPNFGGGMGGVGMNVTSAPMGLKPLGSGGMPHQFFPNSGAGISGKMYQNALGQLTPANNGMYQKGGRVQRATGGRAKGKTNVNIIISPQSGGQGQAPLGAGVGMGQPPAAPMMPPMPMGAPQMPPQMPPMGMMPQGMMPPGGGMPPMPRKSGGRVSQGMPKYQEKDYGSGSGLGRLEKKKWPTANGTE